MYPANQESDPRDERAEQPMTGSDSRRQRLPPPAAIDAERASLSSSTSASVLANERHCDQYSDGKGLAGQRLCRSRCGGASRGGVSEGLAVALNSRPAV